MVPRKEPARVALGCFPTPVAALDRLSSSLGGPRLLIKRDDLSGLGMGGNKVRKLEFLVAAALELGCDCLITGGAAQSNHCRQTAAAAAALGLECHLALGGQAPAIPEGNLLLDRLFGAHIHWSGTRRKGEDIPAIEAELRAAGKHPYVIPYGGSNEIGALGFVEAIRELSGQLAAMGERCDAVLFPSSSGGTHAGMVVGARRYGFRAALVGVAIDKGEAGEGPFRDRVLELARGVAALERENEDFSASDIILKNDYLGGGYGVVGELERRALGLMAREEGILLDPVYTGRAFGALVDLIERGEFTRGQTLLFWHTGGTPALFPYAREIL
ncbi:MAG TPA: D-cysteine desulfhydrase family protein [Rectinemataceae bacterium]|nr:D-cysteine desulfhydrase family protein [Rectinemataceae bacterium]